MSERDLVEIVGRASTLEERLDDDFVPAEGGDVALVDRRFEAWSQALGRGPGPTPAAVSLERPRSGDGTSRSRPCLSGVAAGYDFQSQLQQVLSNPSV